MLRGCHDNCSVERTTLQVEEKNFMSELEIRRAILSIKVKNCEGSDRIPQRIIVDGAELLIAPFHVLFNLIYMQRTILEQWLVSKILNPAGFTICGMAQSQNNKTIFFEYIYAIVP